jgi:hypothetical protein
MTCVALSKSRQGNLTSFAVWAGQERYFWNKSTNEVTLEPPAEFDWELVLRRS